MITNARVLQPEFIPGEVKHRDAEVSHLSDTLRPIADDGHPMSSFLYGPAGAGKTCIAKYTVQQLREELVTINHQYVNCWEDSGSKHFTESSRGLTGRWIFTGSQHRVTSYSRDCATMMARTTF
jgi:Cdc6-like AAA superfamily ATPase